MFTLIALLAVVQAQPKADAQKKIEDLTIEKVIGSEAFFVPGPGRAAYVLAEAPYYLAGMEPKKWSDCVGFDLRLMSWGDGSNVPSAGNKLAIVGIDANDLLHIRIFDAEGSRVEDTTETKLPRGQTSAVWSLKQQLRHLLPPHVLTDDEKAQVLSTVTSIVDQTPRVLSPSILAQIESEDEPTSVLTKRYGLLCTSCTAKVGIVSLHEVTAPVPVSYGRARTITIALVQFLDDRLKTLGQRGYCLLSDLTKEDWGDIPPERYPEAWERIVRHYEITMASKQRKALAKANIAAQSNAVHAAANRLDDKYQRDSYVYTYTWYRYRVEDMRRGMMLGGR